MTTILERLIQKLPEIELEKESTFDGSWYFSHRNIQYSVGVWGDISILTNITNGTYVKLVVTDNLVDTITQCLESTQTSHHST